MRHERTDDQPTISVKESANRRTGAWTVLYASQQYIRPVPPVRRVIPREFVEGTKITAGDLPDSDIQQVFGNVKPGGSLSPKMSR
jgi:hypothetical protein